MYIQGEGVGELQYSTKQLTKKFDFSSFFDCVLQTENPFKNQTFFCLFNFYCVCGNSTFYPLHLMKPAQSCF